MREDVAVRLVQPDGFDWSADSGTAADVRRIVAAADAGDGVSNLNEAACLHLKNRGLAGAVLHVADGGFALLYDGTLDLVVAPDARRHGVGSALATAALADIRDGVDAWSHADHPAAIRIAERLGLSRDRELWVMERPLADPLPASEPTPGYRVRSFRPGDEEGLLEVNSLAFAHHPEQGHMTRDDFQERQSEPWFDPAGLFVAVPDERDGDEDSHEPQVLGFHWTKVHPEEGGQGTGEVYVVAVNPKAAGRGIGKVLTNVGLRHLRDLGLARVILYVDADNDPAIAVYTRAGFSHIRTEAQYRGVPGV
ncbi:MAG: mycothiol synthase [Marmoricola sp.]